MLKTTRKLPLNALEIDLEKKTIFSSVDVVHGLKINCAKIPALRVNNFDKGVMRRGGNFLCLQN